MNTQTEGIIIPSERRNIGLTKRVVTDSRGMALVITLMMMALLLSVIGAGLLSSGINLKTASHHRTGTQAFFIADAGIIHAGEELTNNDATNDFAAIFVASNGTQIVNNNSFGGGTYVVTRTASAASPDRIKIKSISTAPNGATAEVEAWYTKKPTIPPKAIQTDGDLKVSGNPNIMGTCGGAHSNDDVEITGSPNVQMVDGVTASNKPGKYSALSKEGMEITGNPCIGSPQCPTEPPDANKLDTTAEKNAYQSTHSNAAEQTLPTINPAEYASKVAAMGGSGNHYILNLDGTVTTGGTCGADGLCSGGTTVGVPEGWEFSGGTWKVSGSSAGNGVFYSEGKIEISGNPGTSSTPWQATLIARDSIKLNGNPYMKPYPTSSTDLQNHLLVTGNDLEISGNAAYMDFVPAAILVHQQFKISGNPNIKGFIISGDGKPTWAGDPFTDSSSGVGVNEISGNPNITYSCEFTCTGPGCPPPKISLAGWAQR
jgi:hypothetical protein